MKTSFLILALAVSAGAYAQDWVSVGSSTQATPSSQAPLIDNSSQITIEEPFVAKTHSQSSSGALTAEMSLQLEQLQQEVASLRGIIEQQEHQLQQLQQQSEQRYLDLDQRVSQLTVSAPVVQGVQADAKPKVVANDQQAEDMYQQAMRQMREKKYAEANATFERFVKDFPQHELTGNALYWSGEVWLVQGDLEQALKRFTQVTEYYPNHGKAADATYKMGVTLHRQGKDGEAKKWFTKVVDDFTGKADATVNLAKSYLQRLEP